MLITTIVGLYTTRAVLSILGVENYGIYNVVGSIVGLMSFLNSALSNATTRFLTMEIGHNNSQSLQKTFSASLMIHIALAVFIVFLGLIVGPWYIHHHLVIPTEKIDSAIVVFYFSLAYCFLNITQIPYNALIIANEKMNVYAYVAILETILKLIIVFALLAFADVERLVVYSCLMFLTQGAILLVYRLFCRHKYKESRMTLFYDTKIYGPIVKFALLDVYGNLCAIGWFQGYILIVNSFYGALVNAAYGLSNQIMQVFNKFIDSYLTASKPQITKSYAQNDYPHMASLIYNTSKISFLLMTIVAIPGIFEMQYLFNLWLEDVPMYSVNLTRLSLFYLMVVALLVPVNLGIHATAQMKEISFITGTIYLLALPILYVTLKVYSNPYMAGIFSIIIQAIALTINMQILGKYIESFSSFKYFRHVIIPCLTVALFSFCVTHLVCQLMTDGLLRLLLSCVISGVVTIVSAWFIMLNAETKLLIINFIKKKING